MHALGLVFITPLYIKITVLIILAMVSNENRNGKIILKHWIITPPNRISIISEIYAMNLYNHTRYLVLVDDASVTASLMISLILLTIILLKFDRMWPACSQEYRKYSTYPIPSDLRMHHYEAIIIETCLEPNISSCSRRDFNEVFITDILSSKPNI